MLSSDSISYQTITLDRLTFAAQTAVSRELLEDLASPMQAQWLVDHITDAMVYQIRIGIAAQHLERATVRHPLNWWEACKGAFYYWCSHDHWPWFGDYGAYVGGVSGF